MVSPISTTQATQSVNNGISTLAGNYETFLHLLTTQLKNQDPLSPLDNNEFTQQLTAMTGVQQQLLTNQLLTQLLGQGQADLGGGAVNLIGKEVTVTSADAVLEDGEATWTYTTPGVALATKLEVLDANGRVVWTQAAESNTAGEHKFEWDGKGVNGRGLPEGTYSLRVTPIDSNGKAMAATVSYTAIATGLASVDGQTLLTVGAIKAPLTAVTSVQQAPEKKDEGLLAGLLP